MAATALWTILILAGSPALAQTTASATQYYQYGNRYYQAKDYANAARYYQAAVRLDPNLAQAHQALGNCQYMLGRRAEALASYERALALNPANTQLAAYVNNLRARVGTPAASTPAGTATAAGGNALAQGQALFQQKNYAASVPYFQEATRQTPNDYKPFYYLGYAQYMTRDFKNAAVNFSLANQKQPNAQLKAYADRIRGSLTPADQQWVDAQVAAGGAAGVKSAKGPSRHKKGGIRSLFGIALYKIKDFDADAAAQEAQVTADGDGLTGEVPKGSIWVGFEPFYRPTPNIDLALGFGLFPVGKYAYTASGDDVLGGAPMTPSAGDAVRNVVKVNAQQIGLTARYLVGKSNSRFFIGAGAAYYPSKLNISRSLASADGSVNLGYNGDFTTSGMGFHGTLGGEFMLGKSVGLSPYLLFRALKLKDYEGSLVENTSGTNTDGKLVMVTDPVTGDQSMAVDDGTLPAALNERPLEISLTGIQFGLGISVFF
jgi:tetratricopeptide (TPR) repeat protein